MAVLGIRGQKWLKCFHLVCVALWVGGAVGLVLMQQGLAASAGGELHGIDRAMRFVDDWIVVPGAMGCLLTGLCYGLLTPWGFFKQRWIVVKWIITVGGVVFGTFWLGPWLNSLGPISARLGLEAFGDPAYVRAKSLNSLWGAVQTSTVVLAVFLSVLKPWGRKGRRD